jgi:hypothetical protein
MMKVKVITEFIDKYTQLRNPVGAEIEVTEQRYNELVAAGNYVAPIITPAAESEGSEVTEITEDKPKKGERQG